MKDNTKSKIKNKIKPLICDTIGRVFALLYNSSLKKSLTVFLYHDVSEHPSEFSNLFDLNVYPHIFDYQINFIKQSFNIITPDDLLNGDIPSRAALITFDDGFRSYFKNAVPILNKYRVPSIIFLNMEPIKRGFFLPAVITYLSIKRDGFNSNLKNCFPKDAYRKIPCFFYYNREEVNSFIANSWDAFKYKVLRFTGEFAYEEDLADVSTNELVFYGNHLFNHEAALLLSDKELLLSLSRNADELKKYSNYRDVFSFPFGQPATYSMSQTFLLFRNGVRKIFSSCGTINKYALASCLDRISLTSFNDSIPRIWFKIFRRILTKNQLCLIKNNYETDSHTN